MSRCVSGVSYPFPHARGAITLDQFVQPDAPSREEREAVFNECLACLDRLYPLYEEVLGRLAQIAARVEETLAPERARGRTPGAGPRPHGPASGGGLPSRPRGPGRPTPPGRHSGLKARGRLSVSGERGRI